MSRVISRRDFLKLLGYGAIAISSGLFLHFGRFGDISQRTNVVSAQGSGSWAMGQNTTAVAIHAAVLPNGKIFYLAGSAYHPEQSHGPFEARILNLNTGSEKNLPLSEDLFCVGLTHLANGNVLLAGGTKMYDNDVDNCNGKWHGLNSTYEVDAQSENLIWVSSMAHGRWYPTLVTLPDGKAVVINGLDEFGSFNRLTEVYDPASKAWTKSFDPNTSLTYCVGYGSEGTCAGAGMPCYGGSASGVAPNVGLYPRMHLMPSGLVVTCGVHTNVRSWDPANGKWAFLGQTSIYRHYGASFLLPLHNITSERGKILLVGGSRDADSYATTRVEILDFDAGTSNSPIVREVAPITYRRKEQAPVILPDGKCVIFGGAEIGNSIPVYIPEMFDPTTENWQALPAASVPRVYHQVSLLLPDGRVWTAGSTVTAGSQELRTEFFSPPYLFLGPRPVISGSPNVGNYGGTITIPTTNPPTVVSVSLVRLMSCTHHYEPNQRLIWLQILSKGTNSVTVSAPINPNVAPPGYYMIHVLDATDVPSVAKIIRIPGINNPETFYNVSIPGNKAAALNVGGSTRYGEEALNASSTLVGKSLKSLKVRLRKAGNPSGLVTAKIRRKSDDSVVASFSQTIDSTSLGTAFAEYTFTLATAYTIQSGDRIMIEYGGPAAVNIEIWNLDQIDGANTRRVRYDGASYIGGNTEDVTGTMSSV